MIQENAFKNIPSVSQKKIAEVKIRFQIADASDFNPEGSKADTRASWRSASQAALFRDNYSCRVCGKSELDPMPSPSRENRLHIGVEVHHIIPRKYGGSDCMPNLITLCDSCHRKTFSTKYSGVPVVKQMTLSSAGERINLLLPPNFLREQGRAFRYCEIEGFKRVETHAGYEGAIQDEGERIRTGFLSLARSGYQGLVSELEDEYSVSDYRTFYVVINGETLQARVLLLDGNHFFM